MVREILSKVVMLGLAFLLAFPGARFVEWAIGRDWPDLLIWGVFLAVSVVAAIGIAMVGTFIAEA